MNPAGREQVRLRIIELIREKYGTQSALAAAIGVDPRQVRQWIDPRQPSMSLSSAANLASKTGRSLDWLVLGRVSRVLASDDDLANQLWMRAKSQLVREGAPDDAAEHAIPEPDELMHAFLRPYRGVGRRLAMTPGLGFDLAELELQRDAAEKNAEEAAHYRDALYRITFRMEMAESESPD